MFRIKTSFSHRKDQLLIRIEARNRDLYEFLDRASHLQRSRTSTTKPPMNSTKIVSSFLEFQEQARTVFSGFQRHWACSCNCNGLHSCSISVQGSDLKALFDNGIETKHVKVEIEVQGKLSEIESISHGATRQEDVDNLRLQVAVKNKAKRLRDQGPKSLVKLIASTLTTLSNPANVEAESNFDKGLQKPTKTLKKRYVLCLSQDYAWSCF